jgi:CrcB protein
MTLLVAAAAGALGAVLRYLVTGWAQRMVSLDFPVGTMIVNIAGSLGLGIVVGSGGLDSTLTLSLIGLFGGFTTFSSWMVETIRLGIRSPRALLNLSLSLAGGVLAATVGYTLAG